MADRLDYGNMMHRAMRALIKDVLREVADNGLPGEHHFFITFDTQHPEVELSEWLQERYPEEMTIVLQHWFDGLEIRDTDFSVVLNFGDQPEALTVPLDAIRTFVDPSVEFGLRFETQSDDEDDDDEFDEGPDLPDVTSIAPSPETRTAKSGEDTASAVKPEKSGDAEIVSLDSFRK